jgi:hypothetical protein
MKLMKNLQPYYLLYFITMGSVFGGIIESNANAAFFQCQLKNGHMTFSDRPCLANQKAIQNKKNIKNINVTAPPTIDIATMNAPKIKNKKDCLYLNRLGINRKYEIRAREAHSKYWRADQVEELKQALDNLNKMKNNELEGC